MEYFEDNLGEKTTRGVRVLLWLIVSALDIHIQVFLQFGYNIANLKYFLPAAN